MSVEQEAERLRLLLGKADIGPEDAAEVLRGVDDAVKDAVVHAVAADTGDGPSAVLLSRLKFLRTDTNAAELAQIYQARTGAPDPGVRMASLYGLDDLNLPGVVEGARTALNDSHPRVVNTATTILLRRGGDDPALRALLTGVFDAHRNEPAHRTTLALLIGHGIGSGPLPGDVA
jgi:HEAT repeat protein